MDIRQSTWRILGNQKIPPVFFRDINISQRSMDFTQFALNTGIFMGNDDTFRSHYQNIFWTEFNADAAFFAPGWIDFYFGPRCSFFHKLFSLDTEFMISAAGWVEASSKLSNTLQNPEYIEIQRLPEQPLCYYWVCQNYWNFIFGNIIFEFVYLVNLGQKGTIFFC